MMAQCLLVYVIFQSVYGSNTDDICLKNQIYDDNYEGTYNYYKTIYSPIYGLIWRRYVGYSASSTGYNYFYPHKFNDGTVAWLVGQNYSSTVAHFVCYNAATYGSYYAYLDQGCSPWKEWSGSEWKTSYILSITDGTCTTSLPTSDPTYYHYPTPRPTPYSSSTSSGSTSSGSTSSGSSGSGVAIVIAVILIIILIGVALFFVYQRRRKIKYGDQYRHNLLKNPVQPTPMVAGQGQMASRPAMTKIQYVTVSQQPQQQMVYAAPQSQAVQPVQPGMVNVQPQQTYISQIPQQPQPAPAYIEPQTQQQQQQQTSGEVQPPPPAYKEVNGNNEREDVKDLGAFLRNNDLGNYASGLKDVGAESLDDLKELDDEEIKQVAIDVGMKNEDQQRFINACQQLI